jgi:DNA-binding beta-propeller fold protein YncE
MIDINLMSKQEKIIISVLLGCTLVLLLIMFNPDNTKNERKASVEPQNILTAGGAPGSDKGFFSSPKDIAVDKEGNVYVADSKNNRIQKFNNTGVFILSWGKEGNAPGDFKEPCGIDIGPDGNIYVADTWNGRVEVFTNTGSFVQAMGQEQGLWGPRDVGVDKDGNVYIPDTGNSVIHKLDKAGRLMMTFGKKGGGKGQGEYAEPFSIKQGPDGNMYVADRKNFRIQVVTTAGKYVREFKVPGWSLDQVAGGCLMEPYLSIDALNKKLLVTDSTNHQVLSYNLGGGAPKKIAVDKNGAKFSCPVGIAVFKDGQVLVTDNSAGKIVTVME